ncbi:MAG: glycosyltransferase family A protein [Rhizonema sp. PD37]|nr:glycosyltransferase family A protein [Rhizonema sp. PD37]
MHTNSQLPLVSVIIPAYNAETFIARTLNSVLSQTYENIEILVVDDGSKDKTAEIIEQFAQKDNRIIFFNQANAGVAAARNLAIQNSRGEYIAPLDADDIWDQTKIEKQVKLILQSEPTVGLIYAWSILIDEEGLIIGRYDIDDFFKFRVVEGYVYPIMLYYNFIGNASATLIRRDCFEQVGYYNCQLREQNAQGCEDWDMYLRIAESYECRVVPEFLIGYRYVIGSMSANYMEMEMSYNLVVADIKQRHPEIPKFIYQFSASKFYVHLSNKSYACGNYFISIIWLLKAVELDYMLLLNPRFYRVCIPGTLRILLKTLTSLIWQDHKAWGNFKQKVKLKQKETQILAILDMNEQIIKEKQRAWKLYDIVMRHRWSKVLQSCQTRLLQEKTLKDVDDYLQISSHQKM